MAAKMKMAKFAGVSVRSLLRSMKMQAKRLLKKVNRIAAIAFLMLTASACAYSGETSVTSGQQTGNSESGEQETRGRERAEAETGEAVMPETETPPGSRDDDEEKEEEETMKILVKSDEYEIIYELNGSRAAEELYAQLPLTTEVEPFSSNEMTFYPEKLSTEDTPFSGGEPGSLSYYEPWGDVVMFYAPCAPNNSLYELGTVVSGEEFIERLSGTITVFPYEE